MKKEDKQILRYLVERELKDMDRLKESNIFPPIDFLKSVETYEKYLKDILKSLK